MDLAPRKRRASKPRTIATKSNAGERLRIDLLSPTSNLMGQLSTRLNQVRSNSMSYTRILVALNHDQTEPEVFEQALDLATKKEGASLMLFHCLRAANVIGLTTSPTDPLLGTAFPSLAEVELQQPMLQQQIVQQQTEQSYQWLETYRQQAIAFRSPNRNLLPSRKSKQQYL